MSTHFKVVAEMKGRQEAQDFDPLGIDKQMILDQCLHASDIGNPCKPWNVCYVWAQQLFEEFFAQGDQERERSWQISYLMDRTITNIPSSQVNFINVIMMPLMKGFETFDS